MLRHTAMFSVLLCALACGGSTRRPPLEEVPIDTSPPPRQESPAAIAVTTTTPTATAPSVAQQAKELLQKGDSAGARALIEPRVADHTATSEEITMLRGICKAKKDAACVAKLKGR